MSIVVRIDVDRPYGRAPFFRHALSRVSSDFYFPALSALGYLTELGRILSLLNENEAQAYVFFRRCTLPSRPILQMIADGGHEIGLHLEDSRSFETFMAEKRLLEAHVGRSIRSLSKHGSGGQKFGRHHYEPYEPVKYAQWAKQAGMRTFFGNLEDPRLAPIADKDGLLVYPSAFWLEPAWRDTRVFTVDWLIERAASTDVVLLLHPENVLSLPALVSDFRRLIRVAKTRVFE